MATACLWCMVIIRSIGLMAWVRPHRLTAVNRRNKERITQAETVWSMLAGGACAPRAEFDEGWRYILLGSEHTWDFENPWEPYFHEAISKVKQSYFYEAEAVR